MNRGRHEAISAALDIIPEPIHQLIACHYLVDLDPAFVGLHYYRGDEPGSDGRLYSETSHCAYSFHQTRLPAARRATTIVLPIARHEQPRPLRWTIVHELGHVLDERLGFTHTAVPVNDYAARNRYEAFACAFTAWLFYEPAEPDPASLSLFDHLATP